MTYARLALLELVDEKRLLYFDADLIVQREWKPVYDMDLQDAIVAAVPNVVTRTLGEELLDWEYWNLDRASPGFQAGLLMINLEQWKREKISERTVDYIQRYPLYCKFWDQSALNVMLYRRWQVLPEEWNTPAWWADVGMGNSGLNAPCLHFIGPAKPWLYGYHQSQSAQLFYDNLDLTVWQGWRPSWRRQCIRQIKYRIGQIFKFCGVPKF